jgi:hypothetical protein
MRPQRPVILKPLRQDKRLVRPLPAHLVVLLQIVVDAVIERRRGQPLEFCGRVAVGVLDFIVS